MSGKTITALFGNPRCVARLQRIRERPGRPEIPAWWADCQDTAWNAMISGGGPAADDDEGIAACLLPLLTRADGAPAPSGDEDLPRSFLDKDDLTLVLQDGAVPRDFPDTFTGDAGVAFKKFSDMTPDEYDQWLAPVLNQPSGGVFPNLNTALATDGLWIHVPAHAKVERVIHLCHIVSGRGDAPVYCPRVVLTSGPCAEAGLVMTFSSPGGGSVFFTNALTDIAIGAGGKVSLTTIHHEQDGACHVHGVRVTQHKDSCFENFALITGGRVTRHSVDVTLLEEGAAAFLKGLSLLRASQHAGTRITVRHLAPHGTSDQMYKGIFHENSRGVFNGTIYVHPDAQQTSAYQLNKNLLMGGHSRVSTRPQLEIFADDVKCSHGATVGQLDENEVFYLQARGIPRQAAVRMLATGFAEDLILRVPGPGVQRRLTAAAAPVLEAVSR